MAIQSPLLSLPTELIVIILRKTDPLTLLRCRKVCKLLNSIIIQHPKLTRRITPAYELNQWAKNLARTIEDPYYKALALIAVAYAEPDIQKSQKLFEEAKEIIEKMQSTDQMLEEADPEINYGIDGDASIVYFPEDDASDDDFSGVYFSRFSEDDLLENVSVEKMIKAEALMALAIQDLSVQRKALFKISETVALHDHPVEPPLKKVKTETSKDLFLTIKRKLNKFRSLSKIQKIKIFI